MIERRSGERDAVGKHRDMIHRAHEIARPGAGAAGKNGVEEIVGDMPQELPRYGRFVLEKLGERRELQRFQRAGDGFIVLRWKGRHVGYVIVVVFPEIA